MVVRVSRDGIRVLGNGVEVVPVLEEPVPCAGNRSVAEGGETDVSERDKMARWGTHWLKQKLRHKHWLARRAWSGERKTEK